MANRLSTGIGVLDRELGGGPLAGSVVAYVAPPASQAELLLYELTRERPTLYLTTQRTEQAVHDAFESTSARTGTPHIEYVAGDAPLENARRICRDVSKEATIIIDPVDVLENADGNRYRNFLNTLQNHMQNIGGVAYLHCLDGHSPPALRDTTEHMADVVFTLSVDTDGSEVENRLAVPKFREIGRAHV